MDPITITITAAAIILTGAGTWIALSSTRRSAAESISRGDRIAVAIGAGLAAVSGLGAIGFAALTVLTLGMNEGTMVPGLFLAAEEALPQVSALEHVVENSVSTVSVTLTDAPLSVTFGLLAWRLLPAVIILASSLLVCWLAINVLRARPFPRTFSAALIALGLTVMICGMGAQIGLAVAQTQTVSFIQGQADGPFLPLLAEIELAPMGWCFAIILVAMAFDVGRRLQRETEGLV